MGRVLAAPDGRRGQLLSEWPPQISVIIPHYNDLENLGRCMVLLAEETLPPDDFEVVVADNNSRCGIEEVKRVCGNRAHVVPAPIQGAGAARNAAVAASQGEILKNGGECPARHSRRRSRSRMAGRGGSCVVSLF
jgi:cellulose synthase/poly-beta-1,6-N-acetylglucosamine synthase-like glycosyltransferase